MRLLFGLLIILIALFGACKNQPEIFLGFYLAQSKVDFNDRYKVLETEKLIEDSTYTYNLGTVGLEYKKAFFKIKPGFIDDKLSELSLSTRLIEFKDTLELQKMVAIIKDDYFNKYGSPTNTFQYDSEAYDDFLKINGNGKNFGNLVGQFYDWDRGNYRIVLTISSQGNSMSLFDNKWELSYNYIHIFYQSYPDLIQTKEEINRERKLKDRTSDI